MHRSASISTPALALDRRLEDLVSEIALLQSRIEGMGLDGDCAYERALLKVYRSLLEQRNQELRALRGRRQAAHPDQAEPPSA